MDWASEMSEISRCIKGVKTQAELEQMENAIFKIVEVQPLKKNVSSISAPQFALDISKLHKSLYRYTGGLDQFDGRDGLEAFEKGSRLNIRAEPGKFAKNVLHNIKSHASSYGSLDNKCLHPQKVCVEFSSPNIAKPFHVGHLRSTIIGNVIANMLKATGHSVQRINFVGDWGTQFGLLSLGLVRYANLDNLKTDPLLELFSIYVKINQDVKSECGKASEMTSQTYQEGLELFAKLENGDEAMKVLWKMVNDLSLAELDKMYQRLGVYFTHTMAESLCHKKTIAVLDCLKDAGLLQYDNNGVGYVQMDGEETIGRASVVKSDGSSLYLTRDVASALERQELFSLDRMHYVVDQGQRGHFIKLLHILQKLNVPWASKQIDDVHIRFGRVKGMSTRQGNVVFLRDVLDEARSRVIDSMKGRSTTRVTHSWEEIGDIIGVACIILQDLKHNRASDYTFSWERTLNMKADSGIFVQYCHARLCSMFSGCGISLTEEVDVQSIQNDVSIQNIILHMARYPDVFSLALINLEPHHIVQYLFKLCHLINTAYYSCPVKGQNIDVAQARLLVFECSRQVLANCMKILGLIPLERI
ncbi:Arginine--tRNA ligase [Plakobranchus ocellatus]|uniref:Probable arginine--tRNA ligase, mitochondrial n=1 Tax=Plakobranchus ocellatus TaxID=259542 RepID=A0AAV3ZH86_9GAST|nr:Arginine--tRNA ligase [Plakobranchus ocellatus]